jgi:methylmalonyl-CoA decarboxylase subunit alpha
MGGNEKIKKQHDKGKFTARERIDRLLDPGSFLEIGMFNHSDVPGMEEKTPADSKIAGYGKVDGRQVAIVSNDFTVLTATSSRVAGRKEGGLKVMKPNVFRSSGIIFPTCRLTVRTGRRTGRQPAHV